MEMEDLNSLMEKSASYLVGLIMDNRNAEDNPKVDEIAKLVSVIASNRHKASMFILYLLTCIADFVEIIGFVDKNSSNSADELERTEGMM